MGTGGLADLSGLNHCFGGLSDPSRSVSVRRGRHAPRRTIARVPPRGSRSGCMWAAPRWWARVGHRCRVVARSGRRHWRRSRDFRRIDGQVPARGCRALRHGTPFVCLGIPHDARRLGTYWLNRGRTARGVACLARDGCKNRSVPTCDRPADAPMHSFHSAIDGLMSRVHLYHEQEGNK